MSPFLPLQWPLIQGSQDGLIKSLWRQLLGKLENNKSMVRVKFLTCLVNLGIGANKCHLLKNHRKEVPFPNLHGGGEKAYWSSIGSSTRRPTVCPPDKPRGFPGSSVTQQHSTSFWNTLANASHTTVKSHSHWTSSVKGNILHSEASIIFILK